MTDTPLRPTTIGFDEYQDESCKTAAFDADVAIPYLTLGLTNEAGEVAGKIKKILRGDRELSPEAINAVGAELGDVLWYLSTLAAYLDLSLEEIAISNIEKLRDRMNRGVIKGDGDKR